MAKEKLTLTELKVNSCLTALSEEQLLKTKGGAVTVKGRNHSYNVRWTAVDTRAQIDFGPVQAGTTGKGG